MRPGMDALHFISISGRPLSGKDTQANLLTQRYPDAEVISTGEIFRGASHPSGPYGKYYLLIEPYVSGVDQGSLLPDDVMMYIVDDVVRGKITAGLRTIIFTGFPRTVPQLDKYREWLKSFEKDSSIRSDFLCVAVLEDRSRRLADVRRNTPGIPVREDDLPETLERRLMVYRNQTLPMLRKLAREGALMLIKSNRDIEPIHEDVVHCLLQEEGDFLRVRHRER